MQVKWRRKVTINKILFIFLISMISVVVYAADMPVFTDATVKIEITLNQDFIIEVPAQPTANYEWQFAKPIDQNILSLISSEYKPGDDGSAGKHVFIFKPIAQGMTMVSLKFSRLGEKDMYPLDSKTFIIDVK